MKRIAIAGILTVALVGTAMAQGIPPAFSGSKPPTVALVRELSTGDFFTQWLIGAQSEAEALGIKLIVYSAQGNDAKMVSDMQIAISQKVDAIIVDHGQQATMDPLIDKAVQAGIKVVTFDLGTSNPAVVQIAQNDFQVSLDSTMRLLGDINGSGEVGYVYAGGFDPLDKRKAVWDAVLKFYPGVKLAATWGTVSANTVGEVASQTVAALQAHPQIKAIAAFYDAFAQGAVRGIEQLGKQSQVKIFGADVSTADIQAMIAPGSPWVATTATEPGNIARTAVRAAALLIAGETPPNYVLIQPTLITQKFLRDNNIKNMADLRQALPGFSDTAQLLTPWMKQIETKGK